MHGKLGAAAVTAALLGAISTANAQGTHPVSVLGWDTCYGIAKAGQNSCANQAGTHSCAGQAARNYDGGEFRLVRSGVCEQLGGKLQAFQGTGHPKNMMKRG